MAPPLLQLRALTALHRLARAAQARAQPTPPPSGARPAVVSRPMSAAARAIVDDGVDWSSQRSPERAVDQMVRPHTQAWLRALPPGLWPSTLASRYPRLANQIALAWPDAHLCERSLEKLLADERGGREGFPPAVVLELQALLQHRRAVATTAQPVSALSWPGLFRLQA